MLSIIDGVNLGILIKADKELAGLNPYAKTEKAKTAYFCIFVNNFSPKFFNLLNGN